MSCLSFYKKLLSKEDIDESLVDYFIHDLPKLAEESKNLCEGPISKEEILESLKGMTNNKCPGSDGLPKEFYIHFIHLFIDELVILYNKLFEEELLCPSQRSGIITLLCKDPNNSGHLKNWRPVSLLNVDYKILSKILTNRLSKVMDEIVYIDQTCAVKGRSIHDNIHLIRNVIDYCGQKNLYCGIISLDQSKAFDRVSHKFLFKILEAYGFGPSFIQWVSLLYTDIFSRVLVNGFLSEFFPVTRCVRQGCGLSPLLYVLCIEPFAHRIRSDPHIKGLKLPGSALECRITQYADDSNVFCTSISSMKKVFLLSELYCLASGAKINKEKSFGL